MLGEIIAETPTTTASGGNTVRHRQASYTILKSEGWMYPKATSTLCDPGEARTHDPVIKSHLLYQLSYRVIFNLPLLRLGERRLIDFVCKDKAKL